MKQKLILILCFSFLSTGLFAQVIVDVFINGTKAGQIDLQAGQHTGGLSYKNAVYNNVDRLSIEIRGKSVDGGYFRKVVVIGDELVPMLIASETQGAAGQFDLTDKNIIRRLKKGMPITMYVEKTPANTNSTEAITRVYLGTLTREK